jgi:hypothetical protein
MPATGDDAALAQGQTEVTGDGFVGRPNAIANS